MVEGILIACWLIFIIYWFVSSWFVKPTQEAVWGIQTLRWPLVGVVILIVILHRLGFFPMLHLGSCSSDWWNCDYNLFIVSKNVSQFFQILSVVITIIGLIIAIVARKTLAGNWSGTIEFKKDHELITRGIYGYVRHPIYTGVLLMALGSVLFFQTPGLFFLFFVIIFFIVYKLRKEEELMLKHFPKEYAMYRKQVKMLIPFVI